MNINRVNEIVNGMTAFTKERYMKNELLQEYLSLQSDVINATYNEDHAKTANLRIWDVEKHLQQMSDECNGVAKEELRKFQEECKTLCNLIKAEFSGRKGETKAFKVLENIKSNNYILKNVELQDGGLRTEIDAIVITPNMITIVEVKNTAKNIFISDDGDYYQTGEYLKWDCSIKEKMDIKEKLLRKVLESTGITTAEINKYIVFTDNRIQVQNKCSSLQTCFTGQLVCLIDEAYGNNHYSILEMRKMREAIEKANHKEAYLTELNAQQFKQDFAIVLTLLEEAKKEQEVKVEQNEESVINGFENNTDTKSFLVSAKEFVNHRCFKVVGATTIAALVIGTLTAIIKRR